MSIAFLTIPQKSLTQSISSSAMAFKISNIKSWAKNALGVNINLTAADFGTQAFGVFRNDTGTIIEIFEFDPATIASTSITILRRGLNFNGDLTTETTNYKLDWPAGTTIMLGTDTPQLFQWLKEYIDGIAISGSPDASETAKGIVEEATDAEVSSGASIGGTGAKLFITPAKLQTFLNDAIVIETTTGVTHSLTTIAGEKVIVWAKGDVSYNTTTKLNYNGVQKDIATATSNNGIEITPFALMYTETPGAATQNITVTSTGSVTNVVIIVMKVKSIIL